MPRKGLCRAGNQNQVRRCHGDFHLRNIVLIEDRPVLFDAIEFDAANAARGVPYDSGFLLMDPGRR
jgi:aminoglycoside phosphotransferase family enzyme